LTTGDFLSIAAVCAVVCIALLGPTWASLSRTRKRLKEVELELGTDDLDGYLYRKLVAITAERGFVGVSNSLEFFAGILQRVYEKRLHQIDAKRALDKLHGHRSEVERAWMELQLLTGDRVKKTSALQQLERLGDRRTIQSIELQLRDETDAIERGQLEKAMEIIRNRTEADS
jgi:hypothetical protein